MVLRYVTYLNLSFIIDHFAQNLPLLTKVQKSAQKKALFGLTLALCAEKWPDFSVDPCLIVTIIVAEAVQPLNSGLFLVSIFALKSIEQLVIVRQAFHKL